MKILLKPLKIMLFFRLNNQNNRKLSYQNTSKLILLVLILINFVQLAEAQKNTNIARSPLAITQKNFNCAAYKKSTENLPSYGLVFLWNTFGDSYSCLESEINNPKVKSIEAHIINGPCIRNEQCGKYEYIHDMTTEQLQAKIDADDTEIKNIFIKAAQDLSSYLLPKIRADQKCYINPILESDITFEEYNKVLSWIKPIFNDRCTFVWNPHTFFQSTKDTPIIIEKHGTKATFDTNNCFANNDGTIVKNQDQWNAYFNRSISCIQTAAWVRSDNCMDSSKEFIDPRKRSCADTKGFDILNSAIYSYYNSPARIINKHK